MRSLSAIPQTFSFLFSEENHFRHRQRRKGNLTTTNLLFISVEVSLTHTTQSRWRNTICIRYKNWLSSSWSKLIVQIDFIKDPSTVVVVKHHNYILICVLSVYCCFRKSCQTILTCFKPPLHTTPLHDHIADTYTY